MASKLFDALLYETAAPDHVDYSDAYANNKQAYITFQHVASGRTVSFKAFITAYNETFMSDWTQESLYGRVDPIYMFKQTTRRVTLAFNAPASSAGEAYENLGKIQKLAQFLYPTYVDVQEAQTISQSPLVRIKLMNLLSKYDTETFPYGTTLYDPDGTSAERQSPTTLYGNYAGGSQGLLGVIGDLTFNPNLEGEHGVIDPGNGIILPKLLEVNLTFSVIHEHAVGWNEDGNFTDALTESEEAAAQAELMELLDDPDQPVPSDSATANQQAMAAELVYPPISESREGQADAAAASSTPSAASGPELLPAPPVLY